MESFFIGLAWIVVLGGGAWAGAKAAFVTTLVLKMLFGKATQTQQQHVVYVQVPRTRGRIQRGPDQYYDYEDEHGYYDAEVIDVTPRVERRGGYTVS